MYRFRTILFMIWLVAVTFVLGILYLPFLVLPRRFFIAPCRFWRRSVLFGFYTLIGVRVIVKGRERLPEEPFLLAPKHQAMWDTLFVYELARDPAIILKRELLYVPIFGWYLAKSGPIPIDRTAGAKALRSMIRAAEKSAADGRSVVIFPEGTRARPGETLPYRPGVAALYTKLGRPCVPVALTSGRCWPGRGFAFRPGTITVEILDPIPPGQPRDVFMAELEERIETATRRLLDP